MNQPTTVRLGLYLEGDRLLLFPVSSLNRASVELRCGQFMVALPWKGCQVGKHLTRFLHKDNGRSTIPLAPLDPLPRGTYNAQRTWDASSAWTLAIEGLV